MTTPQFQRRTHRAREAMLSWARTMTPDVWSRIEAARLDHPRTDPAIYVPFAAACETLPPRDNLGAWAADVALACGWGAWRMTQGIYRYDPALYAALRDTPVDQAIPIDVLDRMPEWAVYIETPDWHPPLTDARACDGVLIWRNRASIGPDGETDVLQFVLLAGTDPDGTDYDREVLTLPLADTIEASIQRRIDEINETATMFGVEPADADEATALRQTLPPILSLLLYLCSEAPDLTRRGQVDAPANPEPKRTRRHGWRLFPADGPREWDVGVRIGAALRAAYQRAETGGDPVPSGRHVRPHVRRAHWHTILSGKRKRDDGTPIPPSEQRRELRWMPPLPINVDDAGALPAVIRKVKP